MTPLTAGSIPMLHDAHNHLQDEWLAPHLDRIARAATDLGIADRAINGTHPELFFLGKNLASTTPLSALSV